ncbi:pentatricopeptide repeat-containing protein at5g10690 [Phtheirospermum japonicum]|uniref:Pentatricopeptide repeat-containing protein at5g10690 n=1 Tax=Phtheirospermum japonicum TaxID=374723 RepID=A0A830BPQ4_9LAMI|nr:pentatricopeptide repeat-containing protein at5g10690 [Phtheirospermum japonicum]
MSEPEGCGVDEVTYGTLLKKRVMVVVDQSSHSKHAMMWALTHVTNKGDILTLLHIVSPNYSENDYNSSLSPYLATTLGSLCKASKPEVEVEALVIQGPKMATVISQVKKLEVSVLVLGTHLCNH